MNFSVDENSEIHNSPVTGFFSKYPAAPFSILGHKDQEIVEFDVIKNISRRILKLQSL